MTMYEDEIDLRLYLNAIIKRWIFILIPAIGLAALAFGGSLLIPRRYESVATILLTRSRSTLELADQFPTISEPIDARSRMDAILAIAVSEEIATKALAKIENFPADEEQTLESFMGHLKISNAGDAIFVQASAKEPGLAAEIANVWAQEATLAINLAYSGEQPLAELRNQLARTRQEYETSQISLEDFIQNSRIAVLESQISEARNLLNETINYRIWQISYLNERLRLMEQSLVEAEALKRQVDSGSTSTAGRIGDAVAVLHARAYTLGISEIRPIVTSSNLAETVTIGESLPSGLALEIQLNDLTDTLNNAQNYPEDLQILIDLFEEEKDKVETLLADLSQEIITRNEVVLYEETATRLRVLEAQLEQETAKQLELTSQRDLAWQAYQAVAQKDAEIKNTSPTANQVTIVSRAIPPEKPESRGTVRNTAIGGLFGGLLGLFWVIGTQWWRSTNDVK